MFTTAKKNKTYNFGKHTLISQAETFKTQAPQHEIGGVAGHQRSHRPKALFSLDLKLKKHQRLGRSFGLIIKKPQCEKTHIYRVYPCTSPKWMV